MVFNENWYSDEQLQLLRNCCKDVESISGSIIEIGCWEGRSTVEIANTCYPNNFWRYTH
jgi:hypothetical protein